MQFKTSSGDVAEGNVKTVKFWRAPEDDAPVFGFWGTRPAMPGFEGVLSFRKEAVTPVDDEAKQVLASFDAAIRARSLPAYSKLWKWR